MDGNSKIAPTAERRIIMRLVIERCTCDVCKKEVEKITEVSYTVICHTEQMLDGWGAQGVNSYSIRKPPKGE